MWFTTKRNRKRYDNIMSNVDFHFINSTLSESIDKLKECIKTYNLKENLIDTFCFVKVKKINDLQIEVLWSEVFDHNYDKIELCQKDRP